MSVYTVSLSATADDWLEACRHEKLRRRIVDAIDSLEHQPRPPGCLTLKGESDAWRIRGGDYRILYEIHDRQLRVLVIRIADRRDACR